MGNEEDRKILTHPLTEDRGQKWLEPDEDGKPRRDIIPPILDREREIARTFLKHVILIYEGYPAMFFFDDLDDIMEEIFDVDEDQLQTVSKDS